MQIYFSYTYGNKSIFFLNQHNKLFANLLPYNYFNCLLQEWALKNYRLMLSGPRNVLSVCQVGLEKSSCEMSFLQSTQNSLEV